MRPPATASSLLSGHCTLCVWLRLVARRRARALRIWGSEPEDLGCGLPASCLLTLSGHASSVSGCAWSPDGGRVLSASEDDTLKIWDAASGDVPPHSHPAHSSEECVRLRLVARRRARVLSASWDESLKIWDASLRATALLHSHPATSSSGDRLRLVARRRPRTLRVGGSEPEDLGCGGTGECLLTLSGHARSVSGCAWSPDGRRVLSASGDQSLKIWDAASGECLLTLSGHSRWVSGCAWSRTASACSPHRGTKP